MKTFATDGGREREGYSGERNDCVVRAIATATGRSYGDVHLNLKVRGRKDGKVTQRTMWEHYATELGFKLIYNRGHLLTLAKFLKRHPKGTFLVCLRRHLVAVEDGVVFDTAPNGPRKVVYLVYQK